MPDVEDETALKAHDAASVPPVRDEDENIDPRFVTALAAAIEAGDGERVRALTEDLHEADFGDVLEALEPEHRPRLIELLGRDFDFTALTEVDEAVREEILEELEPATVAEGVRDLDSDDAVTILESLDEEDQAEVLDQLPAIERVALQRSLDYPEDSAGRLMQTEFIAVPPFWTVGQTIDHMRETPDLPETFYEIFVVDPGVRLLGSVPLDKLLRSKRPVVVSQIMTDDPDRVEATEPQEEVARMFERYNLVSAAVVDEGNRLVGTLMIDDIVDVIEEEADADIKALGGVKPGEEISDRVLDIARSRFPWLFANMLTALDRLERDPPLRGLDREDGGARDPDADRRLDGRQRRHPDDDGRGARARDPRPRARQRLAHRPPRADRRRRQRGAVRGDPRPHRRRPGSAPRTSAP